MHGRPQKGIIEMPFEKLIMVQNLLVCNKKKVQTLNPLNTEISLGRQVWNSWNSWNSFVLLAGAVYL
jgi:hypothetical protein